MRKIVFVCTGNTCRSPMAEKIFNQKAEGRDVVAESCGVFARSGDPMTANAEAALREMGISDTSHRARVMTADILADAELVVFMTETQRMAVSKFAACEPISVYNDGREITDPFGGNMEEYRRTAAELSRAVDRIIKANF